MTALTITSSTTTGYHLSNTAANPVTVASGVTITNFKLPALYALQQAPWTITNYGTLLSTGAYRYSDGILLDQSSGIITNATGGSVTGYYAGVSVAGTGSIVNAGTIVGSGTSHGYGVILAAGGTVTNSQYGVIYGGVDGVRAAGPSSTIVNRGYIEGYNNLGVGLGAGGVVSNASSGRIYGYRSGIEAYGTNALTVINAARGTIAGQKYGVYAGTGNVGTVTNAGAIYGYASVGAVLLDGGTLDNEDSARIIGFEDGIFTSGTTSPTINNAGSVSGMEFTGIFFDAGGSLTNSGKVSGQLYGVRVFNNAGTVVNTGSIAASATLQPGQTTFDSGGALLMDGGMVTNSTGGVITSHWMGVQVFNAAGTVINAGTISASAQSLSADTTFTSDGVQLADGGVVSNVAGGTIASYSMGVQIFNAAGTVVNAGSISASATIQPADTVFASAGVQLADGGVVTNSAGGDITSQWMGVQIGASTTTRVGGTVVNYGTILAADAHGDGAGVWIHGPGAITNAAGGLISGGAFGIVAYYQTTVVNQGTVFGTEYAFFAKYAGDADRLIDTPGAVFSGTVSGGNAPGSLIYSTLELASGSSTGTITNVGTFINFGQIALDAGASWSLGGSLAAGETVAFGGANAALLLASPSAATIAGFAATDTIVLAGITDVTGLSFNGDTLTVAESGDAGLTLQFTARQNLTYAAVDGSTDISVVPCFLPGTHILTDRGEVPVEKLRVGDSIVTLGGGTRPLCWIGQGRTLATRGRRGAATPVIVRKGALSDNVPHRDLYITKGHSLYIDNVLIPVEFLVNHRSILWDDRAQEVMVLHLELDAHDVLIADGAPSESYRDDGNRWLFRNANAGWDQPPKPPCAPVLTGGALVDAVWQRILDRAGPRPGVPLTDDPDLHLVVDGVRVDVAEQQGPIRLFRLAGRPTTIRIASREAVPTELGLARDARSLGVAVRRIAVRRGTKFLALRADDARLTDGFHAYEAGRNLRWTNGYAALPVEAFARFNGEVEVVLHVAETTQYPNNGSGSARVAV